ncbi:hypothetical protein [Streptomyces sp. RerS4]|uniref:hypothetical protein n=1 Tax=Streptomyces sp. RerS4 TaxID=2942449 RepID=UPI00201C5160|nr:hypothetical protein [Streptomyces sp. RerS4]UQX01004.1 hypothetical protein M4D82_11025 [Streptomyces sp. RerS4]
MGWIKRDKHDEAGLCRWCGKFMPHESRWYRRYCGFGHRMRMYWTATVLRVLDNL